MSGHRKFVGGTSMINLRQRRVFGYMTKADFCAMTGLTPDFIAETGNEIEVTFLKNNPPDTLYFFDGDDRMENTPILPVPVEKLRYLSAKDKKDKMAARKQAQKQSVLHYRAKHAAKIEEDHKNKVEVVAKKLYDFDLHNASWEDADISRQDLYRRRAGEVITLLQ